MLTKDFVMYLEQGDNFIMSLKPIKLDPTYRLSAKNSAARRLLSPLLLPTLHLCGSLVYLLKYDKLSYVME